MSSDQPTLLERKLADLQAAQTQAMEEYRQLMKRALRPSRSDGATLARLIDALRLPFDQVRQDLSAAQQLDELRAGVTTELDVARAAALVRERPTRGGFSTLEGEAKGVGWSRQMQLEELARFRHDHPHLFNERDTLDGRQPLDRDHAARLDQELASLDRDFVTTDHIADCCGMTHSNVDRAAARGELDAARHPDWPMLYSLTKARAILCEQATKAGEATQV